MQHITVINESDVFYLSNLYHTACCVIYFIFLFYIVMRIANNIKNTVRYWF